MTGVTIFNGVLEVALAVEVEGKGNVDWSGITGEEEAEDREEGDEDFCFRRRFRGW
jgi:hypothetical protein